MIYSRFGCEITKIRNYNKDTNLCEIWLPAEGKYPGNWKEYSILCLKADNGIPEIMKLIKKGK